MKIKISMYKIIVTNCHACILRNILKEIVIRTENLQTD